MLAHVVAKLTKLLRDGDRSYADKTVGECLAACAEVLLRPDQTSSVQLLKELLRSVLAKLLDGEPVGGDMDVILAICVNLALLP